jgi:predicted nucleic acid-binding protein
VNIEGEKEFDIYQRIPSKLHRGEAASLAIAAYRHWGFLTDDRAARNYAKNLGVEIGGTLGILVQLMKRNHLSIAEANFQLDQMVSKAKYHSPVTNIAVLLD